MDKKAYFAELGRKSWEARKKTADMKKLGQKGQKALQKKIKLMLDRSPVKQ